MKGLMFLTVMLVLGACVADYRKELDDLTLRELLVKLEEKLEAREFAAREEFKERNVGVFKRFSCATGRVDCPASLPVCRDGVDGVGRCFEY